ncbi:MAG TPA: hypothetical protein VGD58_06525 [Herpetosiphonaceae bacterium]
MNDQLRRYLSQDWDIDEEAPAPERDSYNHQPPKRAAAQTRRQQEKQRGKAIAKHLKGIKQQRKDGKP